MFKNTSFKFLVLAFCVHLLAASQAFCGAPLKINFQGRLDENGQPAAGSKTFVFKIYDAVSGGNLVWTSAAQPLTLADGVFSALLAAGDTVALSTATFSAARFVELSVDGVTLAPRQEMASAPYALVAQALAADADIPPTAIADGSVTDAKVLLTTAAITSGKFGDDRVRISTGAIVYGILGDGIVNVSTAAITAGVFSDERIRISTGAFYADFNGPYQLLQLDAVGRFPAAFVGDGALSANVLVSSVAVGKIYGGAIQDNAVTDDKVYLTTSAISSGRFGDMRVRISTGAVLLGRFSDDRVLITTGAFVSAELLEAAAFNSADQLVKLDGTGFLPALNGSALTNVAAASYSGAVAASQLTGPITDDKMAISTGAFAGGFNAAEQLLRLDSSGKIPVGSFAGAVTLPVNTIAAPTYAYTLTAADSTLLVDTTGALSDFEVRLPPAASVVGKIYTIKRLGGIGVTVHVFGNDWDPDLSTGDENIEGVGDWQTGSEWGSIIVQSAGTVNGVGTWIALVQN